MGSFPTITTTPLQAYYLHQFTSQPPHNITMGLLSKAALVGAGYYAYKHHQNKKRAERGELDMSNQKRDAPNDYYPHDNKSQYGANADYYRDRDSRVSSSTRSRMATPRTPALIGRTNMLPVRS